MITVLLIAHRHAEYTPPASRCWNQSIQTPATPAAAPDNLRRRRECDDRPALAIFFRSISSPINEGNSAIRCSKMVSNRLNVRDPLESMRPNGKTRHEIGRAEAVGGWIQWITDIESIETISSIGLALLLFMIGLEIDLKKMASAGRVITLTAASQIVGCVLLGWLVFGLIGPTNGWLEALYFGVAVAMSSTVSSSRFCMTNGSWKRWRGT